MLVVGTTENVKVWAKNQAQRRWHGIIEIPLASELGVNDVSWAPNLGRSYHLIATAASNDKAATVWKLKAGSEPGVYTEVVQEAELPTSSEVWRIEWNITGTVLATSGDDGSICLWRKNFRNEWNKITEEAIGS
jgi:nucleoporin SEH1